MGFSGEAMLDNSFFSDRGYGIGGGSIQERRSIADKAKKQLDKLEELDNLIQESRQEFAQLAIATRLKSEFSQDVCESERRKPIGCRIQYRQLSNGRLITVKLTNHLPSAALIDWTILIQIHPLASLDTSESGKRRNSFSWSYGIALPRLDAKSTAEYEIYCEHDGPMDLSTATRPFVVRCHLSRYFRDSESSKGHPLTFCIGSAVIGANNLVDDRSMPTFVLTVKGSSHESDRSDFRFCITRSLLMLLFPNSSDLDQQFLEWLFPQVQKLVPGDDGEVMLSLGTNATVQCSMTERVKTDDYLLNIEVTSFGCTAAELAMNLKMAIWIKLMLAIRQLRKYQTKLFLDWQPIAMENSELIDYMDSRLPFA